ncbi:MAG TPA: ATP-dependent DNA helicase [Mycobacteriales bacterium]|nr:ATP-dependent DNA helicase [Mycobacteriales bacterium]
MSAPVLSEPAQLCDLLGLPFTAEQLAAATAPLGPGLVVAGAGSGKTSVMAARVVWLVGSGQVAPEQVLGLTFTNKAATELTHRIRTALADAGLAGPGVGQAGGPDAQPSSESGAPTGEPVVSTYHAFAGRLVADYGLRVGVEPHARLLADATRFQLAARVLRRYPGPVRHLTTGVSYLVGDLISLEAEMSEHLVTPDDVLAWDAGWIAQLEKACAGYEGFKNVKTHCDALTKMAGAARKRQELSELVRAYRAAKRELDALDFGDQVATAALLAETVPEVGVAERAAASVVLLDEYQDTSVAQRRMLVGLFGGGHPVTAVGDPCQAIYGWRGASVSNLECFPTHFPESGGTPASTYELGVNMRSGGRLLTLANRVAEALRLRHPVVTLRAPAEKAELGDTLVALHETWAQEAEWVAKQVRAQVDAGTAPGECAVLVRARRDFGDLHAALVQEGLPVEVVGLGGLLAMPEVADLVATLELIDDPTANAAVLRLLTGPRWRLGARDLAALGRRAQRLLTVPADEVDLPDVATPAENEGPDPDAALEEAVAGVDPCDVVALIDAVDRPGAALSPEATRRVQQLSAELRLLRRSRDEPLLDLMHRVIDLTGLGVELAASPEAVAGRRAETLAAFLDVAAEFADLDGGASLTSFLAFLGAAEEHDRGLDAVTPSGSDAVQLLTAHRAKGLEWDVVVCPDLTRSVFPVTANRDRWTSTAASLPSPLRGDADDQPGLLGLDKDGVKAYEAACYEHLEREERRLAYVAFTRARKVLIGSSHWWGPTQRKPRGPSPFLDELRDHALAGAGEVAMWAEPPVEESNPWLVERPDYTWPAPYDEESYRRRESASTAVRERIAALREGTDVAAAAAATSGSSPAALTPVERDELARLDVEMELLLAEERRARHPDRTVPLPAALSTSQLLRLSTDPAGLARDLARPMPRPPAPAARRGTRFHAWVETLFEQRPLLGPDELPGAEDDALGDSSDLATLQAAFLASPYAERRPHAVEAPFALPLADRVLRGRIDAVYDLGAGRWEVVDWKTGREDADPLQLAVYRLAWARLVGVEVEQVDAAFLYVATNRVVRHDNLPGEAELAALLAGVRPEGSLP